LSQTSVKRELAVARDTDMRRDLVRVRLFFINCPRLDTLACSYLLLAQNPVQSVFEFEVYHYWVFATHESTAPLQLTSRLLRWWADRPLPFRRRADGQYKATLDRNRAPVLGRPLNVDEGVGFIRKVIEEHDKWLSNLSPSYGGWTIERGVTIVVTETPFEGGYYANAEGDVAVLSVANWQKHFAPPSVLEFILSRVQRYALRLGFDTPIGSHYPTRACIWDFDANVDDTRAGVLVGYLCERCEEALATKVDSEKIVVIKKLLSHDWIGKMEDPGSVASNMRRVFSYDLSRTRGLSPGIRERLVEVGASEAVKWIAIALLAFLVGHLSRVPQSSAPPDHAVTQTKR
jgi:hypothetical protein